jgi:hypothetical protein
VNPSKQINEKIAELADWLGDMFSKLRKITHDADVEVTEEWKWMGTPTFSHDGSFAVVMRTKTT